MSKTNSRVFYFLAYVTMVFVAGLRNKSVGTDTGGYCQYFDKLQYLDDVVKIGEETQEYGYWIMNWLVHFISDQYMTLFIVIALIVIGCYQRMIIAYSANIVISFYVFITMGIYTFFFNGARQGIACAICALAIGPMMERNLIKYLGYILLACFFHKTAIIMVPVYFIFNKYNTLKSNILYGIIGITGFLSLQAIVDLGTELDARYATYADAGEGGGNYIIAFSCLLTLFFLAFKKKVHVHRGQYNLFLNMLIFGTVLSLTSFVARINPSGILRLALYFNVSIIFLWAIVFENITNRGNKMIVSFVFFVGYLAFFQLTTEKFSNLVPYTFNPSLPF